MLPSAQTTAPASTTSSFRGSMATPSRANLFREEPDAGKLHVRVCATRAAHRGFQIVKEHGDAGISGGKGRDKCPAFGSVSDRAICVGLSEGDAAEGQAASRIRSTTIPRVKKRWRRALGGRFRLRRERMRRWFRSSSKLRQKRAAD